MTENKRHIQKTVTYFTTVLTVAVFIISENITTGPFFEYTAIIDSMRIKYVLLLLSFALNILLLYKSSDNFSRVKVFAYESKCYITLIGILTAITVVYQLINGFKAFSISELAYMLVPLIFVITVVSCDYPNIPRIINCAFYCSVLAFVLCFFDLLKPSIILTIDFATSYSPFETSNLLFVCLELFFLVRYGKREWKSTLSLFLAILTFKRVAVIKAILFYIFVPIIKNKKVPKWLLWGTIGIFIILPFVLEFFYSDTFSKFMLARYSIDFNMLTMDRYRRTNYVLKHLDEIKYGLGSVTNFLENNYGDSYVYRCSLHSDILKIYLETSILGTIAFTVGYFKSVKTNIFSYLLMLHIFTEMNYNHPLGAGNVGNWIIIYLIIVYFNYRDVRQFYSEDVDNKKNIVLSYGGRRLTKDSVSN